MQITFTGLWHVGIKVSELTQHFCLNIDMTTSEFKKVYKQTLVNSFISTWDAERQNLEKNPILRFYNKIKYTFLDRKLFDWS